MLVFVVGCVPPAFFLNLCRTVSPSPSPVFLFLFLPPRIFRFIKVVHLPGLPSPLFFCFWKVLGVVTAFGGCAYHAGVFLLPVSPPAASSFPVLTVGFQLQLMFFA